MAWTDPKTWAIGEELRSADLNTYVRDNSADLDARVLDLEARLAAIEAGGYEPFGSPDDTTRWRVSPTRWRRDGGIVTINLYALLEEGQSPVAQGAGETLFTLPEAFRHGFSEPVVETMRYSGITSVDVSVQIDETTGVVRIPSAEVAITPGNAIRGSFAFRGGAY